MYIFLITVDYETARQQCLYYAKHGSFEESSQRGRGHRKKISLEPYTPFEDSSSEDTNGQLLRPSLDSDSSSSAEDIRHRPPQLFGDKGLPCISIIYWLFNNLLMFHFILLSNHFEC